MLFLHMVYAYIFKASIIVSDIHIVIHNTTKHHWARFTILYPWESMFAIYAYVEMSFLFDYGAHVIK